MTNPWAKSKREAQKKRTTLLGRDATLSPEEEMSELGKIANESNDATLKWLYKNGGISALVQQGTAKMETLFEQGILPEEVLLSAIAVMRVCMDKLIPKEEMAKVGEDEIGTARSLPAASVTTISTLAFYYAAIMLGAETLEQRDGDDED